MKLNIVKINERNSQVKFKRPSSPKMRAPMGLERAFQSPPPPKIAPITVNLNEITVKILTLDQEPVTVKLDKNDTLSVVKVSNAFKGMHSWKGQLERWRSWKRFPITRGPFQVHNR